MTPRWDILGLGAVAVDDLLYVAHYPVPDTKQPVLSRRREGGGLTATALVAAARLGAKTAYATTLGEDELSRFSIEALEQEGVDCSLIHRQHEARPFHSIIIVDQVTGQRTILYSTEGVTSLLPAEISEAMVSNCRAVFVDNRAAAAGLRAAEMAHRHDIPVIGDIELEIEPETKSLLAQIDHLIVGVDLARRVTGETEMEGMVRALAGRKRACCVVTAGARGCWYAEWDGPVRHVPAFPVQPVDTNGCGDVFHGAYAACLVQGESIAAAIEVASAAAAIKATRPGGRSGIPDRAAVDRFLRMQRQENP